MYLQDSDVYADEYLDLYNIRMAKGQQDVDGLEYSEQMIHHCH